MKRFIYFTMSIIAGTMMLASCGKEPQGDGGDTPAALTVSPAAIILDAAQTESTLRITCGAAWSVSCDAAWITSITPSSGSSAVKDQVVTVTSTPNDGALRSATIRVVCGSETKNVIVSQAETAGKESFAQAYIMKATLIEDSKGFNMLSDGDFEDSGDQALNVHSPWWAVYSDHVQGGAESGDWYCCLNHDDIDENLGFQTVCTKPNTEYEVSAWFLSNMESGSPDTYFGMRIGTGIRPVNYEVRLGDDFTTTWKRFSITGNVKENTISEAYAFYFQKEGYIISWDNVTVKRPGDTQKSYMLTNPTKVGTLYAGTSGDITSADGVTAWEGADGKICFAFGPNVGDSDFASRANAFGSCTNLNDIAIAKNADGKVLEILPPSSKESGILPTAGVYAGGKQWIHYQQIREKEYGAGLWKAWGAGLAYSEDGKSWTRSDVTFSKNGNFMEVAFLKDGGYVYMFGSSLSRDNAENTVVADEHYVKLGRCAEADLGTASEWRYWNGTDWVAGEDNAAPIVYAGTLGELSVIKNSTTGRYLMLYSSLKRNAVVVRDANSPEGDWSGEHVVYDIADEEVLYAPSFLPVSASGNEITFIISTAWGQ